MENVIKNLDELKELEESKDCEDVENLEDLSFEWDSLDSSGEIGNDLELEDIFKDDSLDKKVSE